MATSKIGLSLRYKLLIILTTIPVLVLGAYLVMATSEFKKDKLAYVYESSVSVANSLGTQVKLEVEAFLEKVRPVLEGYDYSIQGFPPAVRDNFLRQNRVVALVVYQHSQGGAYVKLGQLTAATGFENEFIQNTHLVDSVRVEAIRDEIVIQSYALTGKHLVTGFRFGQPSEPNHRVMVALMNADDLLDSFSKSSLYRSFLLSPVGTIAIGPRSLDDLGVTAGGYSDLFSTVIDSELPRGTVESTTPSGKQVLISYTDPRVGGMVLASVVDKAAALEAVDTLVAKSLLFFLALICGTLIISMFASFQLTSTLRELYEGTRRIAQGQFDVRVKARSRDEIGGLAESFNWMAGEVSRLLSETAQKARMENELATVKTVQETLFPPSRFDHGPMHIVGHFEPASECGGDWWNYSKIDDKVWLWIGDATGHGAPAALITSAAKSASSIIENLPNMSPGRALEIMNRAIYETSKGQIMMTFFLASVDIRTGEMVYANASHDPPYLIRKGEKPLTKKDLVPLMDVNGPRLGDRKDSTYEERHVQLQANDAILFYTDGVIDLQNLDGKAWGERQFIRSVVESASAGPKVEQKVEHLKTVIRDYRENSELIDDITFFMAQFEEAA